MSSAQGPRSVFASLFLLATVLGLWEVVTFQKKAPVTGDAEYQAMVGAQKSGLPTPLQIAKTSWHHLRHPFHAGGANDKGIRIQLAFSIGPDLLGFSLAMLIAVPLGFLVGTSPLLNLPPNPYIQLLKPTS